MTSLSCTRSVNWLCAAHKHNLTHSAQYIKGHNSRTKIQFFWDVTLCCWCVVSKIWTLDLEDEGSTILRNVGNCSPSDTVSHCRRLESSATPQMSHINSLRATFILLQQMFCNMELLLQLHKCQRSTAADGLVHFVYVMSYATESGSFKWEILMNLLEKFPCLVQESPSCYLASTLVPSSDT